MSASAAAVSARPGKRALSPSGTVRCRPDRCWASLWVGTCEVADDTDGDHRWCAGTLSPSDPLFTGPDAMLRINSRAGGLAGHAPTPVAPSRRGPRGGTLLACEERPVIVVLDEQDARRQLDAGRLACPGCGGRLGPWGHARARQVRQPGGQRSWLRPRRACCAGCGATHVLLPAACLPRRADRVESVGAALLAGATGRSPTRLACRPTRCGAGCAAHGGVRRGCAYWLPVWPTGPTPAWVRSRPAARCWLTRSRRSGRPRRRSLAGWASWRLRRGRSSLRSPAGACSPRSPRAADHPRRPKGDPCPAATG